MSEALYVCPRLLERDPHHGRWGRDLSDQERREFRRDAEEGGERHGDGHTAVHFIYSQRSAGFYEHPDHITCCEKCGARLELSAVQEEEKRP